jgi:maleylacetoacetate isomerase/maleylpyruvate isomerase
MKLYGYWRSTSSYRVRIALNLKGISVETNPVHLVRDGGEHNQPAYRAINPQGRVPALAIDDETVLIQSPAIIEYLEETYPTPSLLPQDPALRARIRAVAAIIGCDIHPLHNSGPLGFLRKTFGHSEADVADWIATWVGNGLATVEQLIGGGGYCFGKDPGLADVYLIPQLYAARRFSVPLDAYPRIRRVEALALEHSAFKAAHPGAQLDAE